MLKIKININLFEQKIQKYYKKINNMDLKKALSHFTYDLIKDNKNRFKDYLIFEKI